AYRQRYPHAGRRRQHAVRMRDRMFKRTIIILITLPTIVALGYARYTWTQWHEMPLPLSEARTIHVEPGTSLSALALELASNRIINHSWELKLLARLDNNANRIQAGEYR